MPPVMGGIIVLRQECGHKPSPFVVHFMYFPMILTRIRTIT